jgi:hypothetical protein
MFKVLTYICKLVVIEYDFYSAIKPALIGEACTWMVLQIFNRTAFTWMNKIEEVQDYGQKVIDLVRGFRSVHSNLKNSERFADCKVLEMVYGFFR